MGPLLLFACSSSSRALDAAPKELPFGKTVKVVSDREYHFEGGLDVSMSELGVGHGVDQGEGEESLPHGAMGTATVRLGGESETLDLVQGEPRDWKEHRFEIWILPGGDFGIRVTRLR